jgi:hypothetical protein
MKPSAEKLIRPDILGMPAYKVADATGLIKLDAMENPFACPRTCAWRWARDWRMLRSIVTRIRPAANSSVFLPKVLRFRRRPKYYWGMARMKSLPW